MLETMHATSLHVVMQRASQNPLIFPSVDLAQWSELLSMLAPVHGSGISSLFTGHDHCISCNATAHMQTAAVGYPSAARESHCSVFDIQLASTCRVRFMSYSCSLPRLVQPSSGSKVVIHMSLAGVLLSNCSSDHDWSPAEYSITSFHLQHSCSLHSIRP